MRHFNINANLIRMIQNLYEEATSAVYLNNSTGDWFRTTVGPSGIHINAEKTKLMTNNTSGFSTDIGVNGEKLDCVNRLKYMGAIIADDGSKPEILARIAQATAALTKLKTIWNDRNIALSFKDQTHALPSPYSCTPVSLGH
ncbi:hypothetical protein NP493_776g01028 [Ridgeia piscesae]|uniref:Reverse transcriptase domain-containing protein n=1 Tax=Ridgeia piscesae TaxID=27915 RepID=A0AAD9KP69_RIDPI|nr:hypothetical protein NP493_776g01028 [Ridgeia piscesae]